MLRARTRMKLTWRTFLLAMLASLLLAGCGSSLFQLSFTPGEGATGAVPQSRSLLAGSFVQLPSADGLSNDPARFVGWAHEGDVYDAGDYFRMPAQNATLTATWSNTVELRFVTASDVTTGTPPESIYADVTSAIEVPGPATLAKAAWSFLGWRYNGVIYPEGAYFEVPPGGGSLEATWSDENAVRLSFAGMQSDVQGALPEDMLVVVGSTIVLPDGRGLRRGDWTFMGWTDGLGVFDPGGLYVVPSEPVILRALWNSSTVVRTVSFAPGEDASGTPPAPLTGTEGTVVTLPGRNGLIRPDSVFVGWEFEGVVLPAGSPFVIPGANIELLASWEAVNADTVFTVTRGTLAGGDDSSVAILDANGDEFPDVMVVGEDNEGDVFAILYFNNGDRTFTASEQSDFGDEAGKMFVGVDNAWIATNDVDGDGDDDIFIVGDPDRTDSIADDDVSAILYFNQGDGTFARDEVRSDLGLSSVDERVAAAEAGTGFVGLFEAWAAFVDYDNDGDADLFTTGDANEAGTTFFAALLYDNDGTGTFTLNPASFAPKDNRTIPADFSERRFLGHTDSSFEFADLDGDGYLDLFVSGNIRSDDGNNKFDSAAVYMNTDNGNGGRTFQISEQSGFQDDDNPEFSGNPTFDHTLRPTVKHRSSTVFADVDGDGDLDLFFGGETAFGNHASLYLNDGTGTFTLSSQSSGEVDEVFTGMQDSQSLLVDFDGDGDVDILHSGEYEPSGDDYNAGFAYVNDGSGVFRTSSQFVFPFQDGTFVTTDLDVDGDLDVLQIGEEYYEDNNNSEQRWTAIYWNQTY